MHKLAYQALLANNAKSKAGLVQTMLGLLKTVTGERDCLVATGHDPLKIPQPGQPDTLVMVRPKELKQRGLGTDSGKACFLHAIAHIEFNAINLALDAVYRFNEMPWEFYWDWLTVAAEEAQHHELLTSLLSTYGYQYGDFPAHNGLWDIAMRTDNSLLDRMAMVPCVFEARGLDVTPPMIKKLENLGDNVTAEVLQHILNEEVAHVAVGLRWYHYVCAEKDLDPIETFERQIMTFLPNRRQGPYNDTHRELAGFSKEWLARLKSMDQIIQGKTSL